MGWSAILVNPTPAPVSFQGLIEAWVSGNWDNEPAILSQISDLLRGRRIAGVIALTEGSVGLAASIRKLLQLPGIDPETARICRDKIAMKSFFREKGIAVTDWMLIGQDTSAQELIDRLGLPLVIKQRDSCGSRGLVIAKSLDQVKAAARPGLMAERFIAGKEMSIESFISGGKILLVNPTEYYEPLWVNLVPHAMDKRQEQMVLNLNRQSLAALAPDRCMTHLELFCTENGPVLGEIALRPPGGHLMELLEIAYGRNFWEALLQLECGVEPSLPARHGQYAGMRILYPGPGLYRGVRGLEEARALPGIVKVSSKIKREMSLPTREGSGQEAGHILARGSTREAVLTALDDARRLVQFERSADDPENRTDSEAVAPS